MLEVVKVYTVLEIFPLSVMYYIYVTSGPTLLIESVHTTSHIEH